MAAARSEGAEQVAVAAQLPESCSAHTHENACLSANHARDRDSACFWCIRWSEPGYPRPDTQKPGYPRYLDTQIPRYLETHDTQIRREHSVPEASCASTNPNGTSYTEIFNGCDEWHVTGSMHVQNGVARQDGSSQSEVDRMAVTDRRPPYPEIPRDLRYLPQYFGYMQLAAFFRYHH